VPDPEALPLTPAHAPHIESRTIARHKRRKGAGVPALTPPIGHRIKKK
jgi:hypothetical protein